MADYHSLLMRAVANLPNAGTPATRGAIYERARKALLEQLRSLRPPLPESDITREEKALDAAIAEIEERYGSQDPAPPPASAPPTPTSPVGGKPGAAPAKAIPPPPQFATVQRPTAPTAPGPAAPSARSPSQTGAPGQPGAAAMPVQGAAQRPPPPTQERNQPTGSQPRAPTPPAGKPAATAPTVASPARSQLAAAMANQPSFASRTGRAAPSVGAKGGKDEGLPGLAALDPAKAVRPNKTDDGNASDAPPVVATRHDEPGQWAEAPEVAAEFDRPGLASRPEAEIQRPVAPGADVAKAKPLLWIAAAVVLGVVLAVAGAAILMRQKPQDLAIKPPVETQQPASPEPSAKIAERVPANAPAPAAPPPPASGPQAGQSSAQGAAAPATPAPEAPSAPPAPAPSAGRAAMLVASADNPQKPAVSLGSTVWSLIPPAPGQPATVAVKAEADIPDLKMHATMTLRKNTDPTLQATHTIDLKFSFAEGAPITGFKDVGLPQMRKEDSTAAEALTSVKVKISDTYFLIALAKGESDTARNLDLMQTRSWFDFPLLLNDDRIAKVVFQKSPEGQAMLEKAFEAWK
ncbi:MAG TPA: hypothetical protein VGL12_10400 [Roseiarcus sp.]